MRESYKGDEREDRAKRSAFCGFKAVYFVSITVVGYLVMKEASWFPAVMGGSGDAGTAFDDWPYMSHETYPLLKGYMMIQLGYHTFSLFTHMTATSRNDYMEFLLHHIATIVLIMCGYMMNYCPMSSLIMIIHDVVDIWIYIVKALIDTRYTNFAFLFWVVLMFTFAYCRLYVFPFHLIWYSMWFNQKPENIPGFWLMYMLLHILLILHFYWYFLLIKGGYTYLTKGKATDFVKIAKKPEERKD
jgi:ceramide synthetase